MFRPHRLATALLAVIAGIAAQPAGAAEPFHIGILNDQSGLYADISGPGAIEAARMAIEDFGGTVLGRKVELLTADHQNKADTGSAIAREWFEKQNLEMIADIGNTSVALGVQGLAAQYRKPMILTSVATSDFTGKSCSPFTVQWTNDTWSNTVLPIKSLVEQGLGSFFFITADYGFGYAIGRGARADPPASGRAGEGSLAAFRSSSRRYATGRSWCGHAA